jgi:hypothetical protein
MTPRPLGIDPSHEDLAELPGLGLVRLGFMPWAKYESLHTEALRAYRDARERSRHLVVMPDEMLGGADVGAAEREKLRAVMLLRFDPRYTEDMGAVHREAARWGVRGWGSVTPETVALQWHGRTVRVLTDAALDSVDPFVGELGALVMAYWKLTEEEKKRSMTSASPTAPGGTTTTAPETSNP